MCAILVVMLDVSPGHLGTEELMMESTMTNSELDSLESLSTLTADAHEATRQMLRIQEMGGTPKWQPHDSKAEQATGGVQAALQDRAALWASHSIGTLTEARTRLQGVKYSP